MQVLDLTQEQRDEIARRKATCPFIGTAVRDGSLPVFNSADRPLASVERVAELGDTGGGHLGSRVLTLFAVGNHSRVPDDDGGFTELAPEGLFSLDFPGSQGSHPGHSGILMGDPGLLGSGRFSKDAFDRLAGHADTGGKLSTTAVGEFVAQNIARDPAAKVLPGSRLAQDLFGVFDEIGDSLLALFRRERTQQDHVELLEEVTKLMGEDNLVGSAGEFGLLFAFLANRPPVPDGREIPDIHLTDVEQMMVRMEFPDGWETWPKHSTDWLRATGAIAVAAFRARRRMS